MFETIHWPDQVLMLILWDHKSLESIKYEIRKIKIKEPNDWIT